MRDRVYMDHAAGSPLRPVAAAAWEEARAAGYGNPGSPHREGQRARAALERARSQVAAALQVPPRAVVFTGGGTEAAGIALVGATRARGACTVTCSALEHPAIAGPAAQLARSGVHVRRVPVGRDGVVDEARFLGLCEQGGVAALLAIHHETGRAQPVGPIGAALRARDVALVCDAALAPGRIELEPLMTAAALVSFSAHKFGGPPGMGVLVVSPGTKVDSPAAGGWQEERIRGGTPNVAGALATAAALGAAVDEQAQRALQYARFSSMLEDALATHASFVGAPTAETGIRCLVLENAEGEALMMNLDLSGVAVGTGSTCALGGRDPSPGLLEMGYDVERAARTVRISFGWNTNEGDVKSLCGHILDALRGLGRLP